MDVETLLSQPRLAYYSESTPVDIYVCDIGEETHGQELVLVLEKLQVICKATFSQIPPFPRFHLFPDSTFSQIPPFPRFHLFPDSTFSQIPPFPRFHLFPDSMIALVSSHVVSKVNYFKWQWSSKFKVAVKCLKKVAMV